MAEAFGVAASALAVTELAGKIAIQCTRYFRDVSNARTDIERLQNEVENLSALAKSVRELIKGPQGARLRTAQKIKEILDDGESQLRELNNSLTPSKKKAKMRQYGLRALKWPFTNKEVEKKVQKLVRCSTMINAALQVDQTDIILGIDEKVTVSRRNALLGSFPVAKGASFDSSAQEHEPTCIKDTRVELLRDIDRWIEDPTAKAMFWLNGMAGTGKSTISRTLAHSARAKNYLGATFFFKRGESDRDNISKFFATIAAQLAFQQPATLPYIQAAIDNDPSIFDRTKREQFQKLVFEPLSEAYKGSTPNRPLLLIVDALDECTGDDDIRLLVSLFSNATGNFKVFLTSRPELHIRLGFSAVEGTYQDFILHEVPEVIIGDDIRVYLEHELSKILEDYNRSVAPNRQLPAGWPGEDIIQRLVTMAVPLFIVAATICRFTAERRAGSPSTRLQKLLEHHSNHQGGAKLSATYQPVLEQMIENMEPEDQNSVLANFHQIVGSIVVLADPLSSSALAHLLNVSEHKVSDTLDFLHSVLSVPSDSEAPIKLLHLSFGDYLLDPTTSGNPFSINAVSAHKRIATACLEIMQGSLHMNICGVQAPGTLRTEVDPERLSRALRPDTRYACRYWVHHLTQSHTRISDDSEVYSFLTTYFLYWLEALGWMGQAFQSLSILDALLDIIEINESSSLLSFAKDARRFAASVVSGLHVAPLQLYSSGLIFAPSKSSIRSTFQSKIPQWITLLPIVKSDWSPWEQKLEGHEDTVASVAFSPDGAIIASASADQTIRLWNVRTEEHKQTLEGHSGHVTSVAFSPDGAHVASASWDRTVRLWNATTGEHKQTFEGHSGHVTSVAFSPDGALISSASTDKTIRLWNARTGEHKQTLEGHSGCVTSVAFSPDSALLASASWDGSIRLWNARTGEHKQTLEGHSGHVTSVAFSPDGAHVASASWDRTVRLWNAKTGEHKQTFKVYASFVGSVAFSPDGAYIAFASHESIRLWSVVGEHKQNLEGHISVINSIVFSPDGAILGSATDNNIHLWSLSGERKQQLQNRHSEINHIAFSPDGAVIASASMDQTIHLWDAMTGECRQVLEDYTNYFVTANVFSPGSAPDKVDSMQQPGCQPCAYQISKDYCWITRNDCKLLWLPYEVRPNSSLRLAVRESSVAFGSYSGVVTIIRFAPDTPPRLV